MTPAEFYSFEAQFETAFSSLLKKAGFNTVPLFPENGNTPLPEDAVRVSFELAETDESILAFRDDATLGKISEAAGFSGTVEITHCVPVTDEEKTRAPYPRLQAQRGRIRALCRNSREALQALLPWYDILAIDFTAPRHRVDQQKHAHEATETIRVRFTATGDLPS